jgi:hypothetical protein
MVAAWPTHRRRTAGGSWDYRWGCIRPRAYVGGISAEFLPLWQFAGAAAGLLFVYGECHGHGSRTNRILGRRRIGGRCRRAPRDGAAFAPRAASHLDPFAYLEGR